ncbi:outer membrane receptor protein involved in Fe transport [Anseongella ginsenosidimutans]|uniref:Outer membrane receptor protein involved in Fe transport n=1 Tax=Anseongella ginsenosidimutans TaxID=496056 RepID=A0A4R3KUI2_9SPHI|nr:TonB-dependent receptor [Anseongella ginsenosidimutans]QEC51615.1 TonB-dependent receptor [Anseongella ginsenosidimutans]TCS88945.1 outer membrane receptor protein involved in Fe transport [Anseongella ginsenosidimutans]
MKNFLLILLSLCFFTHSRLTAQDQAGKQLISGEFRDLSFEAFAKQVEAATSLHFYYDPSQVDSLRVTISVSKASPEEVLKELFRDSDLFYSFDDAGNVFITKGRRLITRLPRGFFEGEAVPDSMSAESLVYGDNGQEASPAAFSTKLFAIGTRGAASSEGQANIAGYVRNAASGETIPGVLVYIENPRAEVVTDEFGYYSITLPKGRHTLIVKAMGMNDTRRQIMLYSNGKLDIALQERVIALKAVTVDAEKVQNIRGTQMGMESLSIKAIKQVPAVFGETDILRAVLTLPGVQSVGEASTGFNVRGGSTDQNLILFNDATIYNSSHLFGFFSAFNPDLIKSVELHKSSIPAKFGGRVSSVLDVATRDGNKNKLTGSAGLGLLTGKLAVEGPLIKDRTSFIAGVRSTYSSWLLNLLPEEYGKSKASFGDFTLHLAHKLNDRNNLYLTGYLSRDRFNLNTDTLYGYHNRNINLKWKSLFSNRFYGVFTAGYDQYEYGVSSEENPVNAYKMGFDINQYNFKTDFTYFLNARHTFDAGLSTIYYHLHPGYFKPSGGSSLVVPDVLEAEQALESAVYLKDQINVTDQLALDVGLRYSIFNYLGPKTLYSYPEGVPREEINVRDTLRYPAGKVAHTWHGPEIRASARYTLSETASLKAGYHTLRQYIHMLSNTAAISPTDIWKLSDPNIRPQEGDQVSFGVYKNLKANTIETSLELYYKRFKNYLDYKSGANLVLNHHIETDVINTKGRSYGIELMLKKRTGKMNGWLSYSWSRSLLRMDDPVAGELINEGMEYPSSFDKPHDFTFIGNYRFSHRFSISLNLLYSTGRPVTLPVGTYDYGGSERVLYSERNAYRIPDYYRADFSMNIEGNHVIDQLTHNSWTLGIYNITGRRNAYSVYFKSENGKVKGYKLSIFGSAIPFVSYNVRF